MHRANGAIGGLSKPGDSTTLRGHDLARTGLQFSILLHILVVFVVRRDEGMYPDANRIPQLERIVTEGISQLVGIQHSAVRHLHIRQEFIEDEWRTDGPGAEIGRGLDLRRGDHVDCAACRGYS